MGHLKPIRDYLETLVHPSAQQDALTASRHRAFIAPRLIGSVVALALFPLYIALRGYPGALEVLVFVWLVAPMLAAWYLSRTGHYDRAHLLSSAALTALVTAIAAATGGIASFAAVWLAIIPLEAALSASRRVVVLAATFALAAAGLLLVTGALDVLPRPADHNGALAALGVVAAALYATGLALGAESFARTSVGLLNAEEDRYRLLARNMTDVITRHGRSGAVLFASPAAESLFGTRVHDLMGHRLFDRVHVADRPGYLSALADAAALGEARSVEFRVRCDGEDDGVARNAQFIWVEMRCRPLDRAATGRDAIATEVVAVMRDVTDRKNQEQALDVARQEANRANEAKGRFLATMSHELRTPLNAIIGFSEMLTQEDKLRIDAVRRQEYAQLIKESGTHLLSVVNDILDMSKMETGDFEITPEPFAPNAVIRSSCDLLALKAREGGVDLVTRLDPDLPEMIGDKRAFKQVMLNLLSNAIRFSNAGGRVTVGGQADAAVVTITVQDTGIGIGAEDMPKIGSPFFQARSAYDRRHDGTGLGLSIVKGLVLLHGGTVDISSRLGEGTRVTVRLPRDCERAKGGAVQALNEHPSFERIAPAGGAGVSNQEKVKKRA